VGVDDGLEPLPASLARTWGNTETMEGRMMSEGGEAQIKLAIYAANGKLVRHVAVRQVSPARWELVEPVKLAEGEVLYSYVAIPGKHATLTPLPMRGQINV